MKKSMVFQSLTLVGLFTFLAVPVAAADVASCQARCTAERTECLVAAKDVLESEHYHRKAEGIGPGEIKDLFPDLSLLTPKKRAAALLVADLGQRYKDRLAGCELTHAHCAKVECSPAR